MNLDEQVKQLRAAGDAAARCSWLDAHADEIEPLALTDALRAKVGCYLRDDPAQARQLSGLAHEVADWADDPLCRASAMWAEANAHYYEGHFEHCLHLYWQVLPAYEAAGDELSAARLHGNCLAVLNHLGWYQEAESEATLARPVLARAGPTPYLGLLELNTAMLYRHLDRYQEALAACERGQAVAEAINEPVLVAQLQVNRALSLLGLDRFQDALPHLEAALQAFDQAGERLESARVRMDLALLRQHTGHHRDALRLLDEARRGFADLGNAMEVATVDWHKAQVYLALNLLQEVIELSQAARPAFANRSMGRYLARLDEVAATAYGRLGEWKQAVSLLMSALEYFRKQGTAVTVAWLETLLADLHLAQGKKQMALSLAQQAVATLESRRLVVKSARARLSLADALVAIGEDSAAKEAYEQALAHLGELGPAAWRYRGHVGLGRLVERAGEPDLALSHYRQAVALVTETAVALGEPEFQAGFLHDKLEAAEAGALLCLEQGDPVGALALLESVRTAGLGLAVDITAVERGPEAVQPEAKRLLAELAMQREAWHWHYSRLHDRGKGTEETNRGEEEIGWEALRACEHRLVETVRSLQLHLGATASITPKPSRSLKAMASCLDERTHLVAYYPARGRLLAFVIGRDTARGHVLPAGWEAVDSRLERLRFSLRGADPHAQVHLRWLYDALMRPLAGELGGCQRLLVVPSDRLYYLPFHALHDGEHYLVERWEVGYLPSVTVAGGDGGELKQGRALAMGYSDGGRLPWAVREAEMAYSALAEGWGDDVMLYLEEQAKASVMAQEASRCTLVHLATHGVFREDNPRFSALQMADGWLLLADVERWRLGQRPLVVLSACETGLGDLRGADLMGLGGAFLQAGAKALLVSLWSVPDEATAALMVVFYNRLGVGENTLASLRAAQRSLLADPAWSHPYYWAGFSILLGKEHKQENSQAWLRI
ncbi:MAG TPA: CHAT domain-containing protein, partial [Anaerolineae bacterium]|nr:CHAT domain-containing protein [Anaerolineae bacterium]